MSAALRAIAKELQDISDDKWGGAHDFARHYRARVRQLLAVTERLIEVEDAKVQLAWMDRMDKIAQDELGARPRGEVTVVLDEAPRS